MTEESYEEGSLINTEYDEKILEYMAKHNINPADYAGASRVTGEDKGIPGEIDYNATNGVGSKETLIIIVFVLFFVMFVGRLVYRYLKESSKERRYTQAIIQIPYPNPMSEFDERSAGQEISKNETVSIDDIEQTDTPLKENNEGERNDALETAVEEKGTDSIERETFDTPSDVHDYSQNRSTRDIPEVQLPTSPEENIGKGGQEKAIVLLVSLVLGFFILKLLFQKLLGVGSEDGAIRSKRRHTCLLTGLSSAGKSALFMNLCSKEGNASLGDTYSSMAVNRGTLHGNGQNTIVDVPGHRRLRNLLWKELAEAKSVVLVVDSVTIHDDKQEGAGAVSELLVSLFQSAQFKGVRRVMLACTKRDEVTSYTQKAVIKLLEAAMTRTLISKRGDIGRVDRVVDNKGNVIQHRGVSGNGLTLDCDEDNKFVFAEFAKRNKIEWLVGEVSAFPKDSEHPYNLTPIEEFLK